MAGTKEAKILRAKEQLRKHRTVKNISKKKQKKRGDIGKEEPGVQIKPREEEGKKGLEEYTNGLTEENHSQDSPSSSTTQQSTPSLQKKTRVCPREGGSPTKENDKEVKDNKSEETRKQQIPTIKNEEEMMGLVGTKTCLKGENNALEATSTLVEEDKANLMVPRDAEKFQMDDILCSKISMEENRFVHHALILPPMDNEEMAKRMEKNVQLIEENSKENERNAKLEEKKAKLTIQNSKLKGKNPEKKEEKAKCEEGSEYALEAIMEKDVLMRQWACDFHADRIGKSLNRALMTMARRKYPGEFDKRLKTFTAAIALYLKVGDTNKLKLLKDISESWMPNDKGALKHLCWDQKVGERYFFLCKIVADLNANKFHPNIKSPDATRRIEKMAKNGEFIMEGIDVGEFIVTQTNYTKV